MHKTMTLFLSFLGLLIGGLTLWRRRDHRADRSDMDRLCAQQPKAPKAFSRDMVADLPEPARRFFSFAIAEGTPLYTVAKVRMEGKFSLGTKDDPKYMDMSATQVLAAPHGFVWKMSGGKGLMRMSGSDSGRWTRFWMAGLVPVARFGGDPDHTRSAFGRYVAEAVFWTPAAVLPGAHVTWSAVSEHTARMTMTQGDLEQAVDVTVDDTGKPMQVAFLRWSNANPEKTHKLQPFGGFLSDFRTIDGFTIPMHVEAGNFFGTDAYFPFFIVDITSVQFPKNGDNWPTGRNCDCSHGCEAMHKSRGE